MRACSRGSIVAVFCGVAFLAPAAGAQGLEDSEIRGLVHDVSGGAIRGAALTLTGSALIGGPQMQYANAVGIYRFNALPPGTYSLSIEAPGFMRAVREQIVLPLALSATVDVELKLALLTESVDVAAQGPVIDVRSSSVVTTLDEHLLQSLPTVRVVADTLALAPGVFNPSIVPGAVVAYGGTIGSNGLYVDGVDITEPRRQFSHLPVNYDWLQQMQVSALGAGAQYGDFTGAIGNGVLRSGANRFSALADVWAIDWKWIDRNGSSLAGREILGLWATTAQVGGPIRRDRAWFFAGMEYVHREDTPLGYHGDATRSERSPRAIVKLTNALTPGSRLEGHLQQNWSTIKAANAGPNTAADALNQIEQSDTSWNIRLTRPLGDSGLLEFRHGGYSSNWHDDPMGPRTRDNPSPVIDGPILRGNSNVYQDHRPLQFDTELKLSRQIPRFLGGSHDIVGGLDFKSSSSFRAQGFPGGRRTILSNGQPVSMLVWSGDRTEAHGKRTAMYLQDGWQVHDRLTLNLGLRVDFNRGSVPAGGAVLTTKPVSPRAGIAWALDRSASTALKVHYGRYYDALLTERVAFMDVPGIGSSVGYQVTPTGERIETFRSAPPGARQIDPDIRQSYVDQYLVALERRVLKQAVLQALFVRRVYADFMAMTDTGSRWTAVDLRDPGPDGRVGTGYDGGVFTAFQQVNPGEQYLYYTNPADASRRYQALQFVLTRRWDNTWQVQASCTFSTTVATVGNTDGTNAGVNDTGDQTGTRSPSVFMSPNGLINAEGRATYDKHEVKVLGVYRAPILSGVNISGVLWRQSGNRWERSVSYFNTLVPFNFQTIRLEPRGSRVTDPVWNLDLRLEPTVNTRIGSGLLGIAFDVFNVTNQGTPLSFDSSSGSSFGVPVVRSNPRTFRLLLRWTR